MTGCWKQDWRVWHEPAISSQLRKKIFTCRPTKFPHTVDVAIRVEELGQQRAFLTGGRGQFGSTLGIAYTVFNLLDREELLSSHIEGGPESLQLALGFAKEGFLGSRGSLALSAFNTFLRPRLSGSVKGPFFKQESEGLNAAWNYALTNTDTFSVTSTTCHMQIRNIHRRYRPLVRAVLRD